jgi:MFS family permease
VLSDRIARVPLLAVSVTLWSVAMVLSGAAGSYTALLVTRLFLGGVQATSGPTLASLIGDFFPANQRGRLNGYILSGELVGGGIGFLVSGEIAAFLSWRWAFWILAIPGFMLAAALWKLLPEPPRGREQRLEIGAVPAAAQAAAGNGRPRRSLEQDPSQMSIGRAVRYVLSVRTNVVVMVASALGFFFFGGIRTFALIFVRGHYHLGQAAATAALGILGIGALAGTLLGGRLADRMIARGRIDARIVVGGWAYVTAAMLFIAPIIIPVLLVALPLYVLAAAALTAPNPPLDAARLDVMPASMWGRAEGVRTVLRTLSVGLAPLLFGLLADQIAHPNARDLHAVGASAANGTALEYTFLIMLLPVAASGFVLLRGRGSYPGDCAAAAASQERWSRKASRSASRREMARSYSS